MDELIRAVNRLTLAPGWTVEAYEHPFEGPYVCFKAVAPNSYRIDDDVELAVRSPVPPLEGDLEIYDWLLWRWLIICSHEGREYFRVDGKAWSDPHLEGPNGPGT